MDIQCVERENSKVFRIDTGNMTYAFTANEAGNLVHLWWGAAVLRNEDLPGLAEVLEPYNSNEGRRPEMRQEYAGWGGYFFDVPALKVTFDDGTRDVLLRYKEHEISKWFGDLHEFSRSDAFTGEADCRITVDGAAADGTAEAEVPVRVGSGSEVAGMCLKVMLEDLNYPLTVELYYKVYRDSDVIDKSAIVYNKGKVPLTIESAQSATWYVPFGRQYRLTYMSGSWGREYQIERSMISQGQILLETKRGTSGPDSNPVFFIDEGGEANEENGRIWFGGLHWSGNWRIAVEKNRCGQVMVTGGISDFDFSILLKGGEKFEIPVFTGGYTERGFGGASRSLHDYQTDVLMKPEKAKAVQPAIFNAYGTLRSNIDEEKLMLLADYAKDVGVELFVVDAGWHGFSDNVHENLEDWEPHRTRFPNGLRPLIEKVNNLGMDFGIWMEPEMTNTNSRFFKEHPDWILKFDRREGTYAFSRWVLNLARNDVREFIYDTIHKLLTDYNIKYFKIDNNRYITEMGRPDIPKEEQKGEWVRYFENFYNIFDRLNKEFPDVIFENCASGGGRVDLEMSRYFTRINRSDNQDPLDILKLHEGFSYAYLPKMAGGGCHISSQFTPMVNGRVTPMKYQAHIAMMGSLAIGENLYELSPEKREELKKYVEQYKEIRETVQLGYVHRLVSPQEDPFAAFLHVSRDRDKGVLVIMGQFIQFRDVCKYIMLRGLDPDAVYKVDGYRAMSGKALMEIGIQVKLRGDYDSKVIRLERI